MRTRPAHGFGNEGGWTLLLALLRYGLCRACAAFVVVFISGKRGPELGHGRLLLIGSLL
jgi:hypothetical protein